MERKDLKNYLKRYKGFKEDDGYYSLKKEYSYSKYNGEVFEALKKNGFKVDVKKKAFADDIHLFIKGFEVYLTCIEYESSKDLIIVNIMV